VWKALKKLEKYEYLVAKILIDPLLLGDASKRRRVYIIIVHRSVLRPEIATHAKLEKVLNETLGRMELPGQAPPDPSLEMAGYVFHFLKPPSSNPQRSNFHFQCEFIS